MQDAADIFMIEGYASVFNEPDQHGDVICSSAFQRHLSNIAHIPVLWQHHPHMPVGKVVGAHADARGLWVKLALFLDTQIGLEAANLIKNGILNGLSIGFKAIKSKRGDRNIRRVLEIIELKEISLVTFPSHLNARIHCIKKTIATV